MQTRTEEVRHKAQTPTRRSIPDLIALLRPGIGLRWTPTNPRKLALNLGTECTQLRFSFPAPIRRISSIRDDHDQRHSYHRADHLRPRQHAYRRPTRINSFSLPLPSTCRTSASAASAYSISVPLSGRTRSGIAFQVVDHVSNLPNLFEQEARRL